MRDKDQVLLEQAYRKVLENQETPCPCLKEDGKCTKPDCECDKCEEVMDEKD
jgi:hypothetical protein